MAACRRLIGFLHHHTLEPDGEAAPFLDTLRLGLIVHSQPEVPLRCVYATSVNVAVVNA